ncbi:MAG TPA: hypothetical protein VFM29_10340, partial [Vicinamibacteria bacterium]|nr:hypothetical protein [Vicinamibacteria bacterium]
VVVAAELESGWTGLPRARRGSLPGAFARLHARLLALALELHAPLARWLGILGPAGKRRLLRLSAPVRRLARRRGGGDHGTVGAPRADGGLERR